MKLELKDFVKPPETDLTIHTIQILVQIMHLYLQYSSNKRIRLHSPNKQTEINELKEEINQLKAETNELKEEINQLKAETNELKVEINTLKDENTLLKTKLNELLTDAGKELYNTHYLKNTISIKNTISQLF